ncbi:hypothetical protein [Natronosalvus rutilus]|uniref:Uncharacterized protein n=1 Tax=Natronosalvus rutilus TaxID=2953753 RepID=A0A9E7N8E0_9EURY|nr:hypothetical protein [Natronosalvus rutilus]UTF53597.1 hypothetical protein NGM29_17805 [Natronosalvus rutilus]
MSNVSERNLTSRTIEGVEALVSTESGEVFIDVPAANPRYIRVEEGDVIQEGDARSRTEEELASDSLRKWTVDTIGPETVIGTDRETDERREWDRESLEQKLAIGSLSTNLTDFERVNVGGSRPADRDDRRSDEQLVTVTAYGNDGRKFTQSYRHIDVDEGGDERRLELAKSEKRIEGFEDDLRKEFNEAVELALRNEGYAV